MSTLQHVGFDMKTTGGEMDFEIGDEGVLNHGEITIKGAGRDVVVKGPLPTVWNPHTVPKMTVHNDYIPAERVPEKEKFICRVCGKCFNKQTICQHEMDCGRCPRCDRMCPSLDALQIHLKDCMRCALCTQQFPRRAELDVHMRTCGRCPKCFKTFPLDKLQRHIQTCGEVACSICGQVLADVRELHFHMEAMHPPRDPAKCAPCYQEHVPWPYRGTSKGYRHDKRLSQRVGSLVEQRRIEQSRR